MVIVVGLFDDHAQDLQNLVFLGFQHVFVAVHDLHKRVYHFSVAVPALLVNRAIGGKGRHFSLLATMDVMVDVILQVCFGGFFYMLRYLGEDEGEVVGIVTKYLNHDG